MCAPIETKGKIGRKHKTHKSCEANDLKRFVFFVDYWAAVIVIDADRSNVERIL